EQPGVLRRKSGRRRGVFFFSSRRRHTRSLRDWSSDVCSSDLGAGETILQEVLRAHRDEIVLTTKCGYDITAERKYPGQSERPHRSEERRVGKESRSRWSTY